MYKNKLPDVIRMVTHVVLFSVLSLFAPAQTGVKYQIVHSFGAPGDGAALGSSVVFDLEGNIYGTAGAGGQYNKGIVYELSPDGGGVWSESVLHNFGGTGDGLDPYGEVTIGKGGILYGTTLGGAFENGEIAYSLTPSAGNWTENILYTFGFPPMLGRSANLVQDSSGNLYGAGGGTFELIPGADGWTGKYICTTGGCSYAGIFDRVSITPRGQIFGASGRGGKNLSGTAYAVAFADGGWQSYDLYDFGATPTDGQIPITDQLAVDAKGNIYGVTEQGGSNICGEEVGCGTVYKLTRGTNGIWQETILYNFPNSDLQGYGPSSNVVLDKAGNLYGVTYGGGSICGCGVVYRLSPNKNGTWTYTVLHNFSETDGLAPQANLTFDAHGNLFGTTTGGGPDNNGGVVFEISRQ